MTSSTLEQPAAEVSPVNFSRTRTALAVALVSFASLLLELALTRLFSVVLFYHFAFLAISVALLGLGAGGVFAYVKREWLEQWPTPVIGMRLCAVNALLILAVLEVVLHLPISLQLDPGNFAKLTVLYLVCGVPFFFTGLIFSIVFARQSESIGPIYGADLLGGALACMAIVPLLNFIGGPNSVLVAAIAMALSAAIWAQERKPRLIAFAVSAALLLLAVGNYNGRLIDVVYAKGQRRDQPWMLFAKWNAISRVEVNQAGEAKYIVIDADASTAIMNVDPAKWDSGVAPDNINLIGHAESRKAAYNWKKDLMSAAPSVANVLRPDGKFAIIGPGGGVDVLRAVANGSKDVTGIEINPIIADTIMRDKYAEYSYNLYKRPEVRIHVGDGRSFIRNSQEKYDVVQMTLVDTWASTAAGAFALSENNLYTVEAFKEYFDHLKPDGFIAITRWEFREPREALRVVSQGIEALRLSGVEDARKHFLVVSDGALDVDGRPVIVLAKKSAFTQEEIARVSAHVSANPTLHILYAPASPNLYEKVPGSAPFAQLIETKAARDFQLAYPYNITPVYDKNPFFFFTLKTGHVLKNVLAGTGRGMDWRINLGVTVLFIVFIISIIAVIAFLILPLLLHKRAAAKHAGGTARLIYFVAVGLGFILVEIALIQRFVLFLGHPTYALTVVVFLMLLASGAGSFVAKRFLRSTSKVRFPILLAAAIVIAYLMVLPLVLSAMIGAGFTMKVLISAALIIPLGFLMGMPFPTGLRAMSESSDERIEWAWAMNAAASVLGSVSAMIIAIHFGLNVTLFTGALSYVVAAGLVGSLGQRSRV